MIISKSEKQYLIKVLMQNGLSKIQALERIEGDNGYLKELTSEVQKKRRKDKKEKTKRFGEEFRKMKSKSLNS